MLYHVTTTGPSIDGFQLGLAQAIRLSQQIGSNQVAIAVAAKTNLDGIVSDSIGENAVKALQKPNGIIQFDGVTIFLITKLIRSNFTNGIILATHVSTKYLNTLLNDRRATDIVYVPWAPQELASYVQSHESTAI